MTKTFITYYTLASGSFRYITSNSDEINTYDKIPDTVTHKFFMFSGYEASDEGLVKFTADFKQWCHELKHNDIYKIYYTYYYTHQMAVETVFKKICNENEDKRYPKWKIEEVSEIENQYMSLCNNGAIMYCEEITSQSYGYDYNAFYPRILADKETFHIPTRQGIEQFTDIKQALLSNTLKYGYYYVSITSSNPNAKKIFAFSTNEVYTHYSINFAYKHRKQFDFKFAYWKEEDGFNSYVYEDEDEDLENLRTGDFFFGSWLNKLTSLRAIYPKNPLLKHLMSSVWGSLSKQRVINRTYKQIQEFDLNVGADVNSDYQIIKRIFKANGGDDYYVLQNNRNPYKYGLARIKSFLTSRGRNKIATLALKNIDSVIRIHTDNVTFRLEQNFSKIKNLKPEDKTTGYLQWSKCNRPPIRL